jgi:hypothetical protein
MLSGCGHCKKAKPEFTKAAEHFKDDPKVEFAAVDCTSYQSVCAANEVTGYPTIKYFSYLNKNVKAYNSGRTVSLICSSVHHVTRLRFRRRISWPSCLTRIWAALPASRHRRRSFRSSPTPLSSKTSRLKRPCWSCSTPHVSTTATRHRSADSSLVFRVQAV